MHASPKGKIGLLAAGVLTLAVSAADATMVTTERMTPPRGGWLRCVVENLAMKPLDFRIEIRDARARIVTNYISFDWVDDVVVGRVLAESYDDRAAYCRVRVGGGWRRDVDVAIEAMDADGTLVERSNVVR